MILRRRHTANFTTISNVLFDDERLAADEIGILAFLLSRPDNWEVRRPALARRFGIGPVAIKRVIRSWMKAGWCQATKVRLPNGTFCVLYDIHDMPGAEMTDVQVTEALSLVSAESGAESADEPPHISDAPPPQSPPAGEPVVADDGVVIYKDITNTDLTNTDHQNSERELARAREKHALDLAEFKRRYPTAASDDQGKIDAEWYALEFDQGEPALAGIVPFLEKLKRDKRTTVPAAWKYLKERRWTLLAEQAAAAAAAPKAGYPVDSPEGRAIVTLHEIAGRKSALSYLIRDNRINFRKPVTPQLLALVHAPPIEEWQPIDRRGGGSWEDFLQQFFEPGVVRVRPREGMLAPWPFAPGKDGKIYAQGTDPPSGRLMNEDDMAEFR